MSVGSSTGKNLGPEQKSKRILTSSANLAERNRKFALKNGILKSEIEKLNMVYTDLVRKNVMNVYDMERLHRNVVNILDESLKTVEEVAENIRSARDEVIQNQKRYEENKSERVHINHVTPKDLIADVSDSDDISQKSIGRGSGWDDPPDGRNGSGGSKGKRTGSASKNKIVERDEGNGNDGKEVLKEKSTNSKSRRRGKRFFNRKRI